MERRVLRSDTRRAAAAAAAAAAAKDAVTPQKKASAKSTKTSEADQASQDVVNSPKPTRKRKLTTKDEPTKAKKAPASKKQKKEAVQASQDSVDKTPPSTPKRKVTKPAAEDESQDDEETQSEEQEDETDQTSQVPTDATDASSPTTSTRKRKAATEDASSKAKNETSPKKQKKEKAEKRELKFISKPPKSFDSVLADALDQRFYILSRTRGGTESCPEEDFELIESTGDTYTVEIGKQLKCDCPQGSQPCKHIAFIMKKVLNAPDQLVYQQALISTELESIFDDAPSFSADPQDDPVERRPIQGNCPICYCKLEEKKKSSIVWCAASCGHNFHMECLKACARPDKVTCPVCHSAWKGDKKPVTDDDE